MAPSNVNAGRRVPANDPTVTSVVTTDGKPPSLRHCTVLIDTHAVVAHAMASTRLLDVLSFCPKLTPETVTLPVCVRALLSTPR